MSNEINKDIKRWNWGAFLMTWIWGLANRTYISLLALIPGVSIIMAFVLGIKGNQWAYKNRKWDSMEQFSQIQKQWSSFGFGILAGCILGAAVILLIVAYIVSSVFF